VNDWDEFPPRDNILNPGYKLEWERFQQKIVTDYLAWQAGIVRKLKRPEQCIVHDFEGGIRTAVDGFEIARHLDVAGANPYHEVQDFYDARAVSLAGDLCRSLKANNYFITETNAQTIGWDSKWQRPPYNGQLRLSVYSHISSGADLVAYWHWHSLHYGQETYWKGVLSHDLEPNRAYREVSKVGKELKRLGARLVNLKKSNKVAILYSIDSYQGIRFMPFHDTVDYLTVLHQFYGALHRLNLEVDFVSPHNTNLSAYRVLVVPPLYVSHDSLLQSLSTYVRDGGHLLMTFKSGFCNEYSTVRAERMPGPLREAAGFSYQEFSSLWGELPLRGDPFQAEEKNRVSVWAEMLELEGATPLAFYDHPFFGAYPAITRNTFGKGTLTYEGTVLSDELQYRVVRELLDRARLLGPDQELPAHVQVKTGTGNNGRVMRYYLNYSSAPTRFSYLHKQGVDLLTNKTIAHRQEVELAPWDLVIVEEQ
jgi:beta-galactosidase